MKIFGILLSILMMVTACDQKGSTDSTKERAKAEQEANNQVENENLAKKAEAMERDLSQRHFFYSAMEGEYVGDLKVQDETYKIKLILARSIPPYTGDRVRQLSEIENDLNNLYFHIQVVQWHPDDASTAVGCRVSGVKPNMDQGSLTIASSDCPNLYNILLSEDGISVQGEDRQRSKQIADRLKQKEVEVVSHLLGKVQPSSNASEYTFSAEKVK